MLHDLQRHKMEFIISELRLSLGILMGASKSKKGIHNL